MTGGGGIHCALQSLLVSTRTGACSSSAIRSETRRWTMQTGELLPGRWKPWSMEISVPRPGARQADDDGVALVSHGGGRAAQERRLPAGLAHQAFGPGGVPDGLGQLELLGRAGAGRRAGQVHAQQPVWRRGGGAAGGGEHQGGDGGRGSHVQALSAAFWPSSLERRADASTASMRAARKPRASSACTPAMVVPPGLVT